MTGVSGAIHDENPFWDPAERRDPVRRVRGRLSLPVTVVTSGPADGRAGLTVSSLMIADGDPSRVHLLVGSESAVWDRIRQTGRFIIQVLEAHHRTVSATFAGARPSPGGPFAGLAVTDGEYGPVLDDVATRIYCTYESAVGGDGPYAAVTGVIDRVDLHDLRSPLQWFRGSYRRLAGRGDEETPSLDSPA